jgi:hypothetical protein
VEIAPEVPVLQGEVGGYEDLGATRRPEDGTVIPDPEGDGSAARSAFGSECLANLFDERKLPDFF